MTITWNEREYTLTETKHYWKATQQFGGISLTYEIPKEDVSSIDEVKQYMEEHPELFGEE